MLGRSRFDRTRCGRAERPAAFACDPLEPRRLMAATAVDVAFDSDFGTGGYFVADLQEAGSSDDWLADAVALGDGDVALVGRRGHLNQPFQAAVVRINPDGSPDASFGPAGIRFFTGTSIGAVPGNAAWEAAVALPDGKLLVGGFMIALDPTGTFSPAHPIVARYNPDGTLDQTFRAPGASFGGVVVLNNSGAVRDLALLPDGKVLAGGYSGSFRQPPPGAALWRLNADGSLDSTFGTAGMALHTYGLSDHDLPAVNQLALAGADMFVAETTQGISGFRADGSMAWHQAEGRQQVIAADGGGGVLVASRGTGPEVFRLRPDGTRDPQYRQPAPLPAGFSLGAIRVEPDGSAALGGRVNSSVALVRLRPDGSVRSTFVHDDPTGMDYIGWVVPAPGGVVVAGPMQRRDPPGEPNTTNPDFSAARFAFDPGLVLDPGGPYTAPEGARIEVSAGGSTYAGGRIVRYEWDADYTGGPFVRDAEGAEALVRFGNGPATANLLLRVTTSDGLVAYSQPATVQIVNVPPQFEASAPPSAARSVPMVVTGTATDPGGDDLLVYYDFGDGTPEQVVTAAILSQSHRYAQTGTYTIRVRVVDEDGAEAARTLTVRVGDVAGTVFRDVEDDERLGPADEPLAGEAVYVDLDDDGQADEGEPRAVTDDRGGYTFDGLAPAPGAPAAAYTVRHLGPTVGRYTTPAGGVGRATVSTQAGARVDFGLTRRARVAGTLYLDRNGDGIGGEDDSPFTLRHVVVYLDLDRDGGFDLGEPSYIPSGGASTYVLRNVEPGTYDLRVEEFGSGGGYFQTFPAAGAPYVVTPGPAEVVTRDFGISWNSVHIGGSFYHDYDRDGVRDPDEPLVAGTAFVDRDNDGVLDAGEPSRTTTPGNLSYTISTLPGTYTVRQVLPEGWTQTQPGGPGGGHALTTRYLQSTRPWDFGRYAPPVQVIGKSFIPAESAAGNDLIRFSFTSNVAPSLYGDLVVMNLDTGHVVPAHQILVANNTPDGPNVVAFSFIGPLAGKLPAGRYRATLPWIGVWDASGARLDRDHVMEFTAHALTAGRRVFYNGSAFDGGDAAADARDDAAVAPDKAPLRPGAAAAGAVASAVNSYVRGINGVMIDLRGLPVGATPTAEDFGFRVLRAGAAGWEDAPAPASVALRRGAGANGSDRVTLTWGDDAVRNGWLEVAVKPTARTGLAAADVFVFGNLVGQSVQGPGAAAPRVDAMDVAAVRRAASRLLRNVPLTSAYDFDRDGRVDARDVAIARAAVGTTLPAPSTTEPDPPPTSAPLRRPRRLSYESLTVL